jgi:hypothetical protein
MIRLRWFREHTVSYVGKVMNLGSRPAYFGCRMINWLLTIPAKIRDEATPSSEVCYMMWESF